MCSEGLDSFVATSSAPGSALLRKLRLMYRKIHEMAEDAASKIPMKELLKYVGTWWSDSSIDRGVEKTVWTTIVDSVEYQLITWREEKKPQEYPLVSFAKGGPFTLPMHKLDFIAHTIFGGDFERAISFVNTLTASSNNWLGDLSAGTTAGALALPESPDAGLDAQVKEQKARLLALEIAKQQIAEDKYSLHDQIPEPKQLSEWLLEEDVPLTFRVADLWPSLGTIFVVAAYKAGKTTLVMNIVRCLIDGGLFLGRFKTSPVNRNVGYLNFEVNENQSKAWLKRLGIKKPERLFTWNLKGFGSPLSTAMSREKFIQALIEKDIEVLIIDPFSGAYRKGDSNHNDEVKDFLLQLDEVARKAGVQEVLMAVHAGNDPNKPRGATTLGDHPDALWNIAKSEAGNTRFFKAEGRDVFLAEEAMSLSLDKITLELSGKTRADAAGESFESLVKNFAAKSPDCLAGDFEAGITGKNSSISAARKRLVKDGVLIEAQDGNAKRYRLAN